ncbi:hypothetical protein [Marinococcus halophilus]|uniref:hypothetical protein n=1 Tax=Marinococcus halophilus TaxID=1371 RepID=UPI0009A75B96|nr:hypothetical protein [Marinococcus halophilus]
MKVFCMIIGICVLTMILQVGINGINNLLDGQNFWTHWTDRIEMALGLGVILGIGAWVRRTFPLKEQ